MSVVSSTLLAGLLLDHKTTISIVPASELTELDIFHKVTQLPPTKQRVDLFMSSKYITSVGIHLPRITPTPYILNGNSLDDVLSITNPYSKLAGKCKIFHKHVANAIESGVCRVIRPKRSLLKSELVWAEFKVSADPYQLYLIDISGHYYPAIDSDHGYVTFINGEFILYA